VTYKEYNELHACRNQNWRPVDSVICCTERGIQPWFDRFVLATQVVTSLSTTMHLVSFAHRLCTLSLRLQAELEEAREEARIKAQEEIVVRIQEAKVIIVT